MCDIFNGCGGGTLQRSPTGRASLLTACILLQALHPVTGASGIRAIHPFPSRVTLYLQGCTQLTFGSKSTLTFKFQHEHFTPNNSFLCSVINPTRG